MSSRGEAALFTKNINNKPCYVLMSYDKPFPAANIRNDEISFEKI
jgi:hypothetical protein